MITQALLLFILPLLTSAIPLPQDSEDIPSGGVGYDPSAQGDTDPGSAGANQGTVSLSKGAIIAISVVAAVVVVGGISTTILFYLAKRRQWQIATTIRRSVKRVGTGITRVMTPRTPHKMTFSPIEKQRGSSFKDSLLDKNTAQKSKSPEVTRHGTAEKTLSSVREEGRDGSMEDVSLNTTGKTKKSKRPTPPPVQVPQSKFEMDSPKTPLWSKVFGR